MQALLIDDDRFALKLLALELKSLGCEVMAQCESALEAIELLKVRGSDVRLIFCDLQMPDVDGVQFVRHLAGLDFAGGLVLVSGEGGRILQSVEKLARAHRIKVLGALSKPVTPEQLREVLEKEAALDRGAPGQARPALQPEDLGRAIVGGELVTHYQPKVALHSAQLIGVEALVRWRHPQQGLVFPDQFIRLAEEHGMIDALTYAVLADALAQARAWQDAGLRLHVAVNVSMDNLNTLEFPDVVALLASKADIELTNLVLEVTESRLMKDARIPLDVLARLRLKRISLAVDDFGTGHSSLAQLRDLPFDELKLDRSFVTGAVHDPALGGIVQSTLGMARQFGTRMVAEGVETRADWDFLRTIGCDCAQGYFIARPMAGTDLKYWLAGWEKRLGELTGAVT